MKSLLKAADRKYWRPSLHEGSSPMVVTLGIAEHEAKRILGPASMSALLKALDGAVRGDHLELGVTMPENVQRNHTFAQRAETPP